MSGRPGSGLDGMLRAHRGGDAVRHRNSHPASVATTTRKVVCGPPGSAQEDDRYSGVKATARASVASVSPEPFEYPEGLVVPADAAEFSAR